MTFASLRILVDEARSVDVALVGEALAMHGAVTAALRDVLPDGDWWWLVDGDNEMVPLCAELPDGCELGLRTSSGKVKVATSARVEDMRRQLPRWTANDKSRRRETLDDDLLDDGDSSPKVAHAQAPSFFNLNHALSVRAQRDPHSAYRLTDLERKTELSNHWSNKRTLLAWIRTALGGERCVCLFPFFANTHGPRALQHVYFVALILLCFWSLWMPFIGMHRYNKIKDAINNKDHRAFYFRGSLQPPIWLIGVVCAVLAASEWGHFLTLASAKPKHEFSDDRPEDSFEPSVGS